MRRVVYVALLRGINVGGKTKIAMAALRDTSTAIPTPAPTVAGRDIYLHLPDGMGRAALPVRMERACPRPPSPSATGGP